MDLFIKVHAFNKDLTGKPIKIKGFDVDGGKWDGLYLVNSVNADRIFVVDSMNRLHSIHIESFDPSLETSLKITILKESI